MKNRNDALQILAGIKAGGWRHTMTDDFGADLLTLLDEDGQEHEFGVLDIIDDDEGTFYALLPTFEDPQAKLDDEGTYYIFQSIEEDGEQELVEVEDDALLDRLAQEFEAHFVELYPDEDEAFGEDS